MNTKIGTIVELTLLTVLAVPLTILIGFGEVASRAKTRLIMRYGSDQQKRARQMQLDQWDWLWADPYA